MIGSFEKIIIFIEAILDVSLGITSIFLPWYGGQFDSSTLSADVLYFLHHFKISMHANSTFSQTNIPMRQLYDSICTSLDLQRCFIAGKVINTSYSVIVLISISMGIMTVLLVISFLPFFSKYLMRLLLLISMTLNIIALAIYPCGIPPVNYSIIIILEFKSGFWVWFAMTFLSIWATTTLLVDSKNDMQ